MIVGANMIGRVPHGGKKYFAVLAYVTRFRLSFRALRYLFETLVLVLFVTTALTALNSLDASAKYSD